MRKPRFKKQYSLGIGYPWFYGIDPTKTEQLGLNKGPTGVSPIQMKIPQELHNCELPKYEIILRRVDK